MKSISKERRKELRKIYEDKIKKEFVRRLKKEPMCSSFEWVELMNKYKSNI